MKKIAQNVSSQINSLYDKAHLAVQLAHQYRPDLFENISTIANLASGAYGVYNTADNQKAIPENIKQKIRWIYQDNITDQQMAMIPKSDIVNYFNQYKEVFPDVNVSSLQNEISSDDVIRINVNRILNESESDYDAVIEIASTILHEALHEKEKEDTGATDETGPQQLEREFINAIASGSFGQGILSELKEINEHYDTGEVEVSANSWNTLYVKGDK